jgi:hypothetical protein
MVINFIKQRWKRIALAVATLAIIGAAVLILLINFYWSPILGDKLKATILKTTDSLYSVNFSKSSLSFLKGELAIDNIELIPNMAVYNRKKKANLAPNSLYSLKIQQLIIHHLHPLNLYFNNRIDVDQIVISSPDLHVSFERNRDQDTLLKDKKTPYQLISKALKSVRINSILLNDVKFSYTDANIKEDAIELKYLNLKATDLLIDSTTQYSKTRFLFCTDVSAELNNFSRTSQSKRYVYNIASLKFSTQSSQLVATGISFKPTKTVDEFFKGNNEDCYAIGLDSVLLNNFDFKAYSKYHSVHASSAKFTNGKFEMYANPAPNDTLVDQSINFPQVALHRLKLDVKIDTVISANTTVLYTEHGVKSEQPGTLIFNRINGKLFNVTNNKTTLKKDSTARAKMEGLLMGRSKLKVDFSFSLTDPNMPFAFKGHLDSIKLKYVNPITMPLGMVKLASGDVKTLDFDVQANRVFATGSLTAIYDNLKIKILKMNEENHLKKMGIISLLANAMIIKRANPYYGEQPRVAHIALKRRISASIFSFMWKSVFMGLKESVGYDVVTEQTIKRRINQFKQNKLTHDARKAGRLQRREERRLKRELRQQQKTQKALNEHPE